MPRLIDTESRTGALVAAVNHLLAVGGPRAVSLRAVAEVSRVSASSIIHHLGSMEQLMRVSAHWTGRARRDQLTWRWRAEGLLAHLPQLPDHVVDARVWLAWCELWRSEPGVEQTMREAREEERALLARQLGYALAHDELDMLVALLDGLTVALCRPSDPMQTARARDLLRRHYPALGTVLDEEPREVPPEVSYRGRLDRGTRERRPPGPPAPRRPPMSQYFLSLPHDSEEEPTMASMDPTELEEVMAAVGAFNTVLVEQGALVHAGGLMPPSTATTVDATAEQPVRRRGPFTTADEYLGGFWIVEATDEETAIGWAERAAQALRTRVEVRALQVPPDR